MRNGHFVIAIAAVLAGSLISTANAQEGCLNSQYTCRNPCNDVPNDPKLKCFHKNVNTLFCPEKNTVRCESPKPAELISPKDVNTAVSCGIAAARERTKGHPVDLSKATKITEDLTFTLVSNSGIGGKLAFGIPVYAGVSVGPSLSDLNELSNTSQITNSFTISDLNHLLPNCKNKAANADWIDYVIVDPDPGQTISRIAVGLEFYVSKTKDDSISINILSLKIGPEFTSETDKTQKVCLTFDFEKPAGQDGKPAGQDEKAAVQDSSKQTSACQVGSSGGGQNKSKQ